MLLHPHILILEDDEDDFVLVKDVIEERLGGLNFQITWKDSWEGLDELLERQAFDVAIIDYRLGKYNGLELAKSIRQFDSSMSIIMLTGASQEDLIELDSIANDIGASDFLSKRDLDPNLLAKSIRYALERARQMRAVQDQNRMFERVLESNSLVLWSENLNFGEGTFYSESIKKVTGLTKQALESGEVRWMDLVHKDDVEIASALRQKAIDEGESQGSYRFHTNNGEIWINESITRRVHPIRQDGYRLDGRIQDVTKEHAYNEQVRLLANSLEQSSEGVLITDNQLEKPGPRIVFANSAMEKISGYSVEELIGSTPRLFQGPKTDMEVRKELKRLCKEGREFTGTAVNYRKDGSEYYVNWCIRPLCKADGTITHFISTQRDVTAEHLQKVKLEQSEQFLKEVGEMALIGGWRFSKESGKVFWNEQVFRIHGLEPAEEVSLEQAFKYFPGESSEQIKSVFSNCIEKGIPYDVVTRLRTEQGSLRWTRAKGEPVFHGDKIVGAWGVLQDITDVYKMEMQNQTFFDMAVEMSCIASRDGLFLELNSRWEDALGWTAEELKDKPILEIIHPDDCQKTAAAIDVVNESGSLYGLETRCRHRDGHWLHMLFHAQLGPDKESIFVLVRDISDRKARESQLVEALRRAEVASEAKNQFLMVMSHELRTPLNPIMAGAELLLENEQNPETRVMLQLIKESASHLTSVIGDVLDISSIEAGRISLDNQPFSVHESVQFCVEFFRAKAEAQFLSLEFPEKPSAGAAGLECIGDQRKFRQILLNLVGNAIKFTQKGTISVEFSHHIDNQTGDPLFTVLVRDTGIGIPEDELDAVFERFHQVSMTKSRLYQGQGLGLALSRELARAMGGDITVESTLGKGSTFMVTLPLKLVEAGNSTTESGISKPSVDAGNSNEYTVLIVEDDPVNQILLQRLLKRLGARYVCVKNGEEGVSAASRQVFDFILMDIQMPVLDGIEATRQIRNGIGPNRDTPIIAVTAHAIPSVREASFEAGMNDFIEKPVSLNDLREKIHTVA